MENNLLDTSDSIEEEKSPELKTPQLLEPLIILNKYTNF